MTKRTKRARQNAKRARTKRTKRARTNEQKGFIETQCFGEGVGPSTE